MGFNSGSSSSEEIGDQAEDQKVVSENAVPASRFYECTYCKRGFTNAQALGGHMNIHRKEKARTKQQKSANKHRQSSKSYEDLANCGTSTSSHLRYYEHDQQQIQNYEVSVGDQKMIGNYSYQHHHFFPAPGSNPSHDCVAPGNENPHLLFDQDHVDLVHVNRDVGETGNGTNKTWDQEGEVDLELRLGLTL